MIEGTGKKIKGVLNTVLISQKVKTLNDKLESIIKEFENIKKGK